MWTDSLLNFYPFSILSRVSFSSLVIRSLSFVRASFALVFFDVLISQMMIMGWLLLKCPNTPATVETVPLVTYSERYVGFGRHVNIVAATIFHLQMEDFLICMVDMALYDWTWLGEMIRHRMK